MIPARRFRATPALVIMLALGTLLVMTALGLLVLSMNVPAAARAAPFAEHDSALVVTEVSTVSHASTPVPSARVPATSTPEPASDQPIPLAGLPVETESCFADEMPAALPTIPGPLVDPNLSLMTGPVTVPLEIHIPALEIRAPVIGVGLTEDNAMASPRGSRENDPIWQTIFWYRGGGIPGNPGMATFAGHYDDTLGRPAVFAYLGELQIGNLITVRDVRSGLAIPFIVTETRSYTEAEAADPAVLARVFGTGSGGDAEAQPMADQVSQLTLITCGGTWIDGSFNLRLVVYATRASYPN